MGSLLPFSDVSDKVNTRMKFRNYLKGYSILNTHSSTHPNSVVAIYHQPRDQIELNGTLRLQNRESVHNQFVML